MPRRTAEPVPVDPRFAPCGADVGDGATCARLHDHKGEHRSTLRRQRTPRQEA